MVREKDVVKEVPESAEVPEEPEEAPVETHVEEPVAEVEVKDAEVPAEEPVAAEPVVEEKPKKETKTRGRKKVSDKVLTPEQEQFRDMLLSLSTTHNAKVLDKDMNVIREVAVKSLVNSLKEDSENVAFIVFDGVISQRIVDVSADNGIGIVVGTRRGNITKMPADLTIWTKDNLY